MNSFIKALYCTIISCCLASCINFKNTLYLENAPNQVKVPEAVRYGLRSGDIILVKLFAPDPVSSDMFDLGTKTNSSISPASIYLNGYSVNDSGFVDLPLAGKTYVKGLTLDQIDSLLTVKVKEYFSYFTLEVKLGTFKITTLGECRSPGVHYVYNNKCTIYEAIAFAGDASEIANKSNVKVVRKMPDGTDKVYKVNLTNFSIYESDVYYMHPNDLIYIRPQKAKVDSQNIKYLTFGFAALSSILLIMNYVKLYL